MSELHIAWLSPWGHLLVHFWSRAERTWAEMHSTGLRSQWAEFSTLIAAEIGGGKSTKEGRCPLNLHVKALKFLANPDSCAHQEKLQGAQKKETAGSLKELSKGSVCCTSLGSWSLESESYSTGLRGQLGLSGDVSYESRRPSTLQIKVTSQ